MRPENDQSVDGPTVEGDCALCREDSVQSPVVALVPAADSTDSAIEAKALSYSRTHGVSIAVCRAFVRAGLEPPTQRQLNARGFTSVDNKVLDKHYGYSVLEPVKCSCDDCLKKGRKKNAN